MVASNANAVILHSPTTERDKQLLLLSLKIALIRSGGSDVRVPGSRIWVPVDRYVKMESDWQWLPLLQLQPSGTLTAALMHSSASGFRVNLMASGNLKEGSGV